MVDKAGVLAMVPLTIERYEALSRRHPNHMAGLRLQKVICLEKFLRIFEKFAGCDAQKFNEMLREPHNPWWTDKEQTERFEKWLGPSVFEGFVSIIHRINDALDGVGSAGQNAVRIPLSSHQPLLVSRLVLPQV